MTFKIILLSSLSAVLPFIMIAQENLILNGDFQQINNRGLPEGWHISHPNFLERNDIRVMLLSDGDLNYLHVEKNSETHAQLGNQTIDLPEGTSALEVSVQMRGKNVVSGDRDWMVPGIGVTYYLEDDSSMSGDMQRWVFLSTGDSEWFDYSSIIPVRENAVRASIEIIGHGWTGEVDFANIVVEAIP